MRSSFNPVLEEQLYVITADIGGTHARFSRIDLIGLSMDKIAVFPCAHFDNLKNAFIHYREIHGLNDIKHAAIAIACPVIGDQVCMTNLNWNFSINRLKKELNFDHLEVLNDLAAAAMSVPNLTLDEKLQIGQGQEVDANKPMVMLGAGTGLGVAYLIPTPTGFVPIAGEGGHTAWAAQDDQEWFIHQFISRKFNHVSSERLLSGPGLENLYLAIAAYKKLKVNPLSASEIIQQAITDNSPLAHAVIEQFFASLGCFAGDLALTLCTFGGVYITGGVVPKLLSFIEASPFRDRFESKGRFQSINSQIPTYVVSAEQPALLGAALYLKRTLDSKKI